MLIVKLSINENDFTLFIAKAISGHNMSHVY